MKRRVLAVLLVMVLLVSMYVPAAPRADAVVLSGATLLGAVGVMILAAVGVNFTQSMVGSSDTLGASIYAVGESLMSTLSGLTDFSSWYDAVITLLSGGTLQQVSIPVPAEVAEYARTWATTNYDFSSGIVTLTDFGILSDNGDYIRFSVGTWETYGSGYKLTDYTLGTSFAYGDSLTINGITYTLTEWVDGSYTFIGWKYGSDSYLIRSSGYQSNLKYGAAYYDSTKKELYLGMRTSWDWVTFQNDISVSNYVLQGETMTMVGTDALSDEKTEDMTVAAPVGATYTDGIPAIQSLTASDVVGTGEEQDELTIGGLVTQSLTSVFVPSQEVVQAKVAEMSAIFEDRLGLLTYPVSVLYDFLGRIMELSETEPILRWNDISWQGVVVIPAGQYNLKDAVSKSPMSTIYYLYRVVISGTLVMLFLSLCYKKYEKVIRGGTE